MSRNVLAFFFFMTLVARISQADAGFLMKATAKVLNGDSNTQLDFDSRQAQTIVAANSHADFGGTSAAADAWTAANGLHARSSLVAAEPTSANLLAWANSEWDDTLFLKRNTTDVLSGRFIVSIHLGGTVDFEPPFPTQWLYVGTQLGPGSGLVSYGLNGKYDEFFQFAIDNPLSPGSPFSWDALNGLSLKFSLTAMVGNGRYDGYVLSGLTDFTASIANVAYIGANGQPDPSVTITSASGTIYEIPEPSGWLLAMAGVASIAAYRRPRFG
jgi:hypothetical protein